MKLKFSRQFSKNLQISNFVKSRQVGAELFHADGRTDMTKLIAPFRNFVNAPKNEQQSKSQRTSHSESIIYFLIEM